MLHVDSAAPPPPVPSPQVFCDEVVKPFDPISYIAYCRAHGAQVRAGVRDGACWLTWDLVGAHAEVQLRHHPDPALDIDADPDNEHLVWETLRAEAYLNACLASGLVMFPWARGCVGMVGEDEDSDDRDFSAGKMRLLEHRDGAARKDCRRGIVFRTLCARFGLDPDDPALCDKVNARMRAACAECQQAAS